MAWLNPSHGIVTGLCISALVHVSMGAAIYWYGHGRFPDAKIIGKDQIMTVTMSPSPDEIPSPMGMKSSDVPRYPEPAPRRRFVDLPIPPQDEQQPQALTMAEIPPPQPLALPEPVTVQPRIPEVDAMASDLPRVLSTTLETGSDYGTAPLVERKAGLSSDSETGGNALAGMPGLESNGLVPDGAIRPIYPRQARRDGREGTVVVRAEVNGQGRVDKVELVTSSGTPSLDQSALTAVRKARFQYLNKHNVDNSGIATLRVHFQLTDDAPSL